MAASSPAPATSPWVGRDVSRRKARDGPVQGATLMPMPASRISDMHVCPMFTGPVPHVGGPVLPPGGITVLIGGLPAARVGDMCVCVGPPDVIVTGAFTVLIKGMPAA